MSGKCSGRGDAMTGIYSGRGNDMSGKCSGRGDAMTGIYIVGEGMT